MKNDRIIYENDTFQIISAHTYYVLRSKDGKGNDQYFSTSTAAKKAIGLTHDYKTLTA